MTDAEIVELAIRRHIDNPWLDPTVRKALEYIADDITKMIRDRDKRWAADRAAYDKVLENE